MRSLHELNDSLAAEQRAMLINSFLVMTHTKADDQASSATAKTLTKTLSRRPGGGEPEGVEKTNGNQFNLKDNRKGFVLANLAAGEKVESHDSKRPNLDVNNFIMACIKTVARAKGVPPEVYFMEYQTSYSASVNARNDFFDLSRMVIERFSSAWLNGVYREFLIGCCENEYLKLPKYWDLYTCFHKLIFP